RRAASRRSFRAPFPGRAPRARGGAGARSSIAVRRFGTFRRFRARRRGNRRAARGAFRAAHSFRVSSAPRSQAQRDREAAGSVRAERERGDRAEPRVRSAAADRAQRAAAGGDRRGDRDAAADTHRRHRGADPRRSLDVKLRATHESLRLLESASDRPRDELNKVRLLSLTDEFTGLPNRRAFMRRLQDEIGRAQRYGSPLALALLDLDEFKAIND